eukprot:2329434-Pleurochrysis_carterae.AAC.1
MSKYMGTAQISHLWLLPGLLKHTGSATNSDHNLDAPSMSKVSSNVQDRVSQMKGPESKIKSSQNCLGM